MIRKFILFIAAITGIMMSSSCTKEQAVPLDREISISAGADLAEETAESKAYISSNQDGQAKTVRWNKGDKIAVFDSFNNKRDFTLADNSAMSATGTFSGTLPGIPVYAAYPASQVESFDGNSFLATIPSAETVKNVTSFSINGTLAFGPVTEDADAFSTKMKHICGFVKFYAPDEAVKKVTLTVDKNIVGKVNVTFNGDGVPEAVLVEDDPANSKSVSFDNIGGGSMYMFSVLPGTYTVQAIKVEYYQKSGKSARTFKPKNDNNTITVVRGESCILGVLPVCDNVVTLDFSKNDQLNLPTGGQSDTKSYDLNCTIDKVETSLEVELGVAPDATTEPTWNYNNGTKSLMLVKVGSYIKLPVIEGKKIVLLKLSTGNSSGTQSRKIYITDSAKTPTGNGINIQGHAMTPDHTYWSAQKDNTYCVTRDIYIYSAESNSNTCIRSITMYYSDSFNWKD